MKVKHMYKQLVKHLRDLHFNFINIKQIHMKVSKLLLLLFFFSKIKTNKKIIIIIKFFMCYNK